MKSIRAPAVFTGALMLWYTSSDLLGFLVEIPRAGFHGLAYAGYFFYPKIPPLPKTTLTNGWYGGGQWLVWAPTSSYPRTNNLTNNLTRDLTHMPQTCAERDKPGRLEVPRNEKGKSK